MQPLQPRPPAERGGDEMKAVWTATQGVGVCTQQPPTPLSPLIRRRDPPMLFPASPYFAASSRNRGGRGRVIESNQQTTVPLRLLPPRLFSQGFFAFLAKAIVGCTYFFACSILPLPTRKSSATTNYYSTFSLSGNKTAAPSKWLPRAAASGQGLSWRA